MAPPADLSGSARHGEGWEVLADPSLSCGGGGGAAGSEDNVRSRIRTAPGDVNAKEWGQTHGRRVRAFPLGRAFRKVSLPCSRPPPPT